MGGGPSIGVQRARRNGRKSQRVARPSGPRWAARQAAGVLRVISSPSADLLPFPFFPFVRFDFPQFTSPLRPAVRPCTTPISMDPCWAGPAPERPPASFSTLPFELQAYIVDWVWATIDYPARDKGVEPIEADVFECFGTLGLVSRRMRELVVPHLWKVSPGPGGGRGARSLGVGTGQGCPHRVSRADGEACLGSS